MLLTRVSAINNNGHAIVKYDVDETYPLLELPTQRRTVLGKKLLLDAAAIFVQDNEIVATAAASQPISIPVLSTSEEIQLFVIQDDNEGYIVPKC